MELFLVYVSFIVTVSALPVEDIWFKFKSKYSREYKSLNDEKFRFEIFKSKLQIINEHNERYKRGEESYTMGINQFSDLTNDELENFLGYNKPEIEFSGEFHKQVNYTVPDSIDWRSKGAVLSIKDQGGCGSCWAFSAIAAIEGQNAIKNGIKDDLSEQELVDCAGSFNTWGCRGGFMNSSYEYVKANGIATAKSYPYVDKENNCSKVDTTRAHVNVTGYMQVIPNEIDLQAAVASIGPISIAINAVKLYPYKSGIFDDETCEKKLTHAVLAVGYGSEDGKDYWIVKNSWGAEWGENGFIRMRRNRNNQCGIASDASYPLIS